MERGGSEGRNISVKHIQVYSLVLTIGGSEGKNMGKTLPSSKSLIVNESKIITSYGIKYGKNYGTL